MKILLAISSCTRDMVNGANQAIRDTWLKDCPYDYKFFYGTTKPNPLAQEMPNFQKDYKHFEMTKFNARPYAVVPETDEVGVDAPDLYSHLTFKLKAIHRWALRTGYDYVFKVDTDTYIHNKLMAKSTFWNYDYWGYPDIGVDYRNRNEVTYAFGGTGFGLSKKSMNLLQVHPVDVLADDAWVGIHLKTDYNISLRTGPEFTEHLGAGTGQYRKEQMYRRHDETIGRS